MDLNKISNATVKRPGKDVLDAGYATTIGPAEFREQKWNKPNLKLITNGKLKGKPGRKPKVMYFIHCPILNANWGFVHKLPSSGLPGRPRKQRRIGELRRQAAQLAPKGPRIEVMDVVTPKQQTSKSLVDYFAKRL